MKATYSEYLIKISRCLYTGHRTFQSSICETITAISNHCINFLVGANGNWIYKRINHLSWKVK
jgi:hypothetical protein